MKILAIDPGQKRIGLAACDELELSTRLLPVLEISKHPQWPRDLAQLISEQEFAHVLWGLPLNMDGTEGEAAERSRKMAARLERELQRRDWAGGWTLWDERLTSFGAEQVLREQGIPKAKAKNFLDSLAAQVLLEDFLRSR